MIFPHEFLTSGSSRALVKAACIDVDWHRRVKWAVCPVARGNQQGGVGE